MNAYELAGKLLQQKLYLIQEGVNSSYLEDASNMLRQQADRIAELERRIEILSPKPKEYLGASKEGIPMFKETEQQTKPVAWLVEVPDNDSFLSFQPSGIIGVASIPLYTTPQTKPLSDEEIELLAYKVFEVRDTKEALFDFARAIEERHGIK